jgi:putative ABC transport system ATP-binding protein
VGNLFVFLARLVVGKQGEFFTHSLQIFSTYFTKMFSLLNILGTIDKPTKGSLEICGVHVANKTTDRVLADLRLHHIGFVFQTFNLLPSLTAVENVEVSLLLLRNCLSYFYFFIIF